MASRHPSDLELEIHLLDGEAGGRSGHIASCDRCQTRVAWMEVQGEEFRRRVYPATVAKVEAAAGARRTACWRSGFALPVPVATAAAALLLVGLYGARAFTGPPEGYVGIKGGGERVAITVFVGTADGARPIASGDALPASSALRFEVQPPRPCHLWVVSLDATGQVSRLYPSAGEGGASISRGGPLPGGAILDGRAGPERIFAVCTTSPLPYASLERIFRRAAGSDVGLLRGTDSIPGLPGGATQASVLIEKRE